MEDKKGGEKKAVTDIDLSDVSSETFKQILQYIYTDSIEIKTAAGAIDLWTTAEKYQMMHLKFLAENYLHDSLDVSKAIEVCAVALRLAIANESSANNQTTHDWNCCRLRRQTTCSCTTRCASCWCPSWPSTLTMPWSALPCFSCAAHCCLF
jgi:hypothetical protein